MPPPINVNIDMRYLQSRKREGKKENLHNNKTLIMPVAFTCQVPSDLPSPIEHHDSKTGLSTPSVAENYLLNLPPAESTSMTLTLTSAGSCARASCRLSRFSVFENLSMPINHEIAGASLIVLMLLSLP